MKRNCLCDEELLNLYYQESNSQEARQHLATCSDCQQKFHELCNDLVDLEIYVPDGGHEAVAEASKILFGDNFQSGGDEIMTPEEVASWLKVSPESIYNILHLMPHLIVDEYIRLERREVLAYLKSQSSGTEMKAPNQSRNKIIPLISRKAM